MQTAGKLKLPFKIILLREIYWSEFNDEISSFGQPMEFLFIIPNGRDC